MSKLSSIENNSLLPALNIQSWEKLISVRENGLSDANFIITNLMKKIFTENGKICLVVMHNTIGHYHNILKRLGHDFMQKLHNGTVSTIEPLKAIVTSIGNTQNTHCLSTDKESIVKTLFLEIHDKIEALLRESSDRVYLVIDDVSHLLDLGVDVKYVVIFLNYCINLGLNERVAVIINCHVSNASDEIVSNCLQYAADVAIDVSPLKTGISHEVTGVITVNRRESTELTQRNSTVHYKAYDRDIKTFAPGESIYHLYK